jgi:dTDP-4-dehydrorhamnose 3,5-epimerase
MAGDGWVSTDIAGVLRRRLVAHEDRRGSFSELWRSTWTAPISPDPFVQANLSRSMAGVLRGMHFHLHQADLWLVLDGKAVVALADLRGAGPRTNWLPPTTLLELGAGEALFIPERIAHGFYAPVGLSLIYFVTQEFDGTDEHGFAWDDPLVAIPWPTTEPLLSDRDRANPRLEEVVPLLVGQRHNEGT